MVLKPPKLPSLYFVKSGSYTYVRTYKNVWKEIPSQPDKKTAYKSDIKTVGKINSNSGVGTVIFYQEFLEQYPELKSFAVIKSRSPEDDKKYKLSFVPKG